MGLREFFFKEKTPNIPLDNEYGDTGTSMYNGMISGEEYNADLSGTAKFTIYDKMRKGDATVAAALKVMKLPLRSANWFMRPAGQDPKQVEQAKFVEYNLMNAMSITWDDFLRQSLLMLDYGVFVFEKVFTNVEYDGKTYIGWRKFAPRQPRTINQWKIRDGKEDGVIQQKVGGGTVEIPIDKLLIFVNEKEGDNWEGISLLRSAYKHWFFKDIFEQIDAMAFERQGLGVPYCKFPAGAQAKDKSNAIAIVKNLRANEKAYVTYPEGYEVGFLDMHGKSTRDPKSSIEYHNRQIVLNVLAQFLMLGSGDSGSFALSKDQSGFFYDSLQAVAKNICDVVNKYAIKQICDINWPGTTEYPELVVDDIGAIDKEKFANMINTLMGAQLIKQDDDLVKYIRKELDLPDEQEGDENDDETDSLLLELELLSVDVAGEGAPTREMSPEDEQQMSDEFDDFVLIFAAKGEPLKEAHKKAISDALRKKYGSKAKDEDIEAASSAQGAIADAKRRIDELKAVVDKYRAKSASIENKKVKTAFNKSVKEKIDQIKAMIKAGREGIKAEKEKAKQAEGSIKKDIGERRMELRKKNLTKRVERDMQRIERLEDQLDQTDSPSKRQNLKDRINDVRDLMQDRKERLQDMSASYSEADEKKNLRQLNEEFKSFRALTAAEKKVNFGNLKKEFEEKEKEFEALLKKSLGNEKSSLIKKMREAISGGDYAAIKALGLKYQGKYKEEVFEKMKEMYNFGKNAVAAEMKVEPPASNKADMERLSAEASVMVDDHEIKVLTRTKMSALDSMGKGVAVSEAVEKLTKTMDEAMTELSQKTASIIAGGSINQGRRLTQNDNKSKIYALQRSELLDERTCNFCMSMDARVVPLDDEWAQEDIFHSNCLVKWNTPIYTSKGWKAVGKIKEGELVLTHRGRFRKVLKTFRIPKQTPNIIRFNFDNYNKNIRWLSVTEEHPLVVNGKMIEAKNLKIGDKIKIMADKCPICGKLKAYYRLTCSKSCGSKLGAKKCWSKSEYKEKMRKIIGNNMKLQYRQGTRNGQEDTKQAHIKTREMVIRGIHPFQKAENQLKARQAIGQKNYGQSFLERKMNWLLEKINLDFIPQYPVKKGLDKWGRQRYYFLDFALPKYKIAIECDGNHWHNNKERENERQSFIEKNGWQILRFGEDLIRNNLSGCALEIQRMIDNHEGRYNFVDLEIKEIKRYVPKRSLMLYNLTVEDDHTYLASGIQIGNCRGIWVEIMKEEPEHPDITGIPKSISDNYEGTNDFSQLKTPQVKKESLAAEAIKDEYKKQIAERKSKVDKYEKAGTHAGRVDGHKKEITRMEKTIEKLK